MPPKPYRCITYAILFTIGTLALSPNGNARTTHLVNAALPGDDLAQSVLPPSTESALLPNSPALTAQALPNLPNTLPPDIIPRPLPPSITPLPPLTLPTPLPPPDQLLQPGTPSPVEPELPDNVPQTVTVQRFVVELFGVQPSDAHQGRTVFNEDDLAALAWQAATRPERLNRLDLVKMYCPSELEGFQGSAPGTPTDNSPQPSDTAVEPANGQPLQPPVALSFEQLLQARTAITQLYIDCGYITSGAILPPQIPEDHDNTVTIQVVEGSLEDINVVETEGQRLHPSYVRSRLAIATDAPLNRRELLEALQLLQLNPLIRRISAELQAGTRPSTNILQVEITEADSFSTELTLNNSRTPSVGSVERGISLTEANLLGLGDGLSIGYINTNGSNGIEASYILPVNPRNGTLAFGYSYTHSNVIESPFDILDISSDSYSYQLTFRQPLYQTPTTEFALGLTLSQQESQTQIGFDDIGPFPLSPGADDEGRTRVSAVRFTQDWTRQSPRQVLAARSQFSLGLDLLDSTINEVAPDSRFFAWRGQGQWLRQLNTKGTLLVARTDIQLTPDALLPLEQFGLGGQDTVRGYRQDALLTDNGILASVEVQFPIVRSRQLGGQVFLVPFLNAGMGWNISSPDPDPSTIVGTGFGLLWRQDSPRENGNLTARLDFGIPLVSIDNAGEQTWQESGVYFSIVYSPF